MAANGQERSLGLASGVNVLRQDHPAKSSQRLQYFQFQLQQHLNVVSTVLLWILTGIVSIQSQAAGDMLEFKLV